MSVRNIATGAFGEILPGGDATQLSRQGPREFTLGTVHACGPFPVSNLHYIR